VQTQDHASADELFANDYAYFSSTSRSWLAHAASYAQAITSRLNLGPEHFVLEVASNDGYLLRNFVGAGIPCLGIEPTANTACAAEALGVPVLREFFGATVARRLAAENRQADLVIGNNVYAHVPDINDFTTGLREVLRPGGTITLEFPHLLELIRHGQFDTVYHEHFSYLSLGAVQKIFQSAGLRVIDVERLPTHGGSFRVYGAHADDPRPESPAIASVLDDESRAGLRSISTYTNFQQRANRIKDDFVAFLIDQKQRGLCVAAYGAAAKGNTLLNYAGVRPDLLPFVCDAAPSKQGKYMPGSRIPILPPSALEVRKPDIIVILPWNIAEEVLAQLAHVRAWGGRFAVAVPEMRLL
jgi:SAM-dependent methyltransferase